MKKSLCSFCLDGTIVLVCINNLRSINDLLALKHLLNELECRACCRIEFLSLCLFGALCRTFGKVLLLCSVVDRSIICHATVYRLRLTSNIVSLSHARVALCIRVRLCLFFGAYRRLAGDNPCSIFVLEDKRNTGTKLVGISLCGFLCGVCGSGFAICILTVVDISVDIIGNERNVLARRLRLSLFCSDHSSICRLDSSYESLFGLCICHVGSGLFLCLNGFNDFLGLCRFSCLFNLCKLDSFFGLCRCRRLFCLSKLSYLFSLCKVRSLSCLCKVNRFLCISCRFLSELCCFLSIIGSGSFVACFSIFCGSDSSYCYCILSRNGILCLTGDNSCTIYILVDTVDEADLRSRNRLCIKDGFGSGRNFFLFSSGNNSCAIRILINAVIKVNVLDYVSILQGLGSLGVGGLIGIYVGYFILLCFLCVVALVCRSGYGFVISKHRTICCILTLGGSLGYCLFKFGVINYASIGSIGYCLFGSGLCYGGFGSILFRCNAFNRLYSLILYLFGSGLCRYVYDSSFFNYSTGDNSGAFRILVDTAGELSLSRLLSLLRLLCLGNLCNGRIICYGLSGLFCRLKGLIGRLCIECGYVRYYGVGNRRGFFCRSSGNNSGAIRILENTVIEAELLILFLGSRLCCSLIGCYCGFFALCLFYIATLVCRSNYGFIRSKHILGCIFAFNCGTGCFLCKLGVINYASVGRGGLSLIGRRLYNDLNVNLVGSCGFNNLSANVVGVRCDNNLNLDLFGCRLYYGSSFYYGFSSLFCSFGSNLSGFYLFCYGKRLYRRYVFYCGSFYGSLLCRLGDFLKLLNCLHYGSKLFCKLFYNRFTCRLNDFLECINGGCIRLGCLFLCLFCSKSFGNYLSCICYVLFGCCCFYVFGYRFLCSLCINNGDSRYYGVGRLGYFFCLASGDNSGAFRILVDTAGELSLCRLLSLLRLLCLRRSFNCRCLSRLCIFCYVICYCRLGCFCGLCILNNGYNLSCKLICRFGSFNSGCRFCYGSSIICKLLYDRLFCRLGDFLKLLNCFHYGSKLFCKLFYNRFTCRLNDFLECINGGCIRLGCLFLCLFCSKSFGNYLSCICYVLFGCCCFYVFGYRFLCSLCINNGDSRYYGVGRLGYFFCLASGDNSGAFRILVDTAGELSLCRLLSLLRLLCLGRSFNCRCLGGLCIFCYCRLGCFCGFCILNNGYNLSCKLICGFGSFNSGCRFCYGKRLCYGFLYCRLLCRRSHYLKSFNCLCYRFFYVGIFLRIVNCLESLSHRSKLLCELLYDSLTCRLGNFLNNRNCINVRSLAGLCVFNYRFCYSLCINNGDSRYYGIGRLGRFFNLASGDNSGAFRILVDTAGELSLCRLLSLLRLLCLSSLCYRCSFGLCISNGNSRYCDIGRYGSFALFASGNNSGAISILVEAVIENNVLDFLSLTGKSLCLLRCGSLNCLGCFILVIVLLFALQVVSSVSRCRYCIVGCEHKSIGCILAYNRITGYCLYKLFVINYASLGNSTGDNLCGIVILEDGGCYGASAGAIIGYGILIRNSVDTVLRSCCVTLYGSYRFLSSLCRFLSEGCSFLCIISCYLCGLSRFLSGCRYLFYLFSRYGGLIGSCGFGCRCFAAFSACKLINTLSICISGLGCNDLAVSRLNCDSILCIFANDNGLDNLALNLGRCLKNLSFSVSNIGIGKLTLNGVNLAYVLFVSASNCRISNCTLNGLNVCNILCICTRNVRQDDSAKRSFNCLDVLLVCASNFRINNCTLNGLNCLGLLVICACDLGAEELALNRLNLIGLLLVCASDIGISSCALNGLNCLGLLVICACDLGAEELALNRLNLIGLLFVCASNIGISSCALNGLNESGFLNVCTCYNGLNDLTLDLLGRCLENLGFSANDIGFSKCTLNGVNLACLFLISASKLMCSESAFQSINCLGVLLVCACNGGISNCALYGLNVCKTLCICASDNCLNDLTLDRGGCVENLGFSANYCGVSKSSLYGFNTCSILCICACDF